MILRSVEVYLKSPINNYREFYNFNEAIEYAWFMCRDNFKHMILAGNRGERVKFEAHTASYSSRNIRGIILK